MYIYTSLSIYTYIHIHIYIERDVCIYTHLYIDSLRAPAAMFDPPPPQCGNDKGGHNMYIYNYIYVYTYT